MMDRYREREQERKKQQERERGDGADRMIDRERVDIMMDR